MQPLRFGLVYDLRTAPGSDVPLPTIYAQAIDQAVLADQCGLDLVWFTEHHFLDDGHLPSFAPMAGAVAARTERVRISTDIALMPFHHPLRLAEDLAVLDNISGGRVELGMGMGYAPHEFRGFGVPIKNRLSLTEEAIEVLQLAFSGERFSYAGRRYRFDDVRLSPPTVQPGGPPLWLGTMSAAGAERAARYRLNLLPQGARDVVLDPWRAGVRAAGGDPDDYRVGIIRSCLVTDDVERDWAPLVAAERYRMSVYERFFAEIGSRPSAFDRDATPIPQNWVIGDVDHCVAELTSFILEHGITDIVGWGAPPGVEPSRLNASVERFATEVVPAVRAAVAAPG